MNILEEIADNTRKRVAAAKQIKSYDAIKTEALALSADPSLETGFPFERALKKDGMSFICECKKASPSKGLIAPDFPYLQIAHDYEAAGADAISVLTEPKWFLGENEYLSEITRAVRIPCLRKDFTVDPYMICEARILGASAVLLICALLSEDEIRKDIELADSLGQSCLVEAHNEAEIAMAVRAGARIIGVNNRNLKDFSVDVGNSGRLRGLVPPGVLFVAESGIKTADDVRILRDSGVDAVLIGEALMRADDKKGMLLNLKGFALNKCHEKFTTLYSGSFIEIKFSLVDDNGSAPDL